VADGSSGVTRRRLLGAGAGTVGGIALAGGGYAVGKEAEADDPTAQGAQTVPFHGRHQAGIATEAQDRLHFAAFDLTLDTADELRELLMAWTRAAALMTAGRPAGAPNRAQFVPPADTGEAFGLPPSRLTVTFGLGPTAFERRGEDRFGLRDRMPSALRPLPLLPGDELDPDSSGGDLCVQACANDPQVAFHAVRNLTRLARGAVIMRWSQLGFGRTSTTTRSQSTPRNLMGLKDGTKNLRAEDTKALAKHVWVGSEGPAWMRDGTYLVARRIRMLIETWDRASLKDQEDTIGRHKYSGAPLGSSDEFDPVDAERLPVDAHVRLSEQKTHGQFLLRRGYSFTDGMDARTGQLDAGLFFICFQRDAHRQFVPIQRRLGLNDALNEYIKHVGSGLFAVPPGASRTGFVGERLFS
jgi:deferrochelatase/peroxidase EfeB